MFDGAAVFIAADALDQLEDQSKFNFNKTLITMIVLRYY